LESEDRTLTTDDDTTSSLVEFVEHMVGEHMIRAKTLIPCNFRRIE